MGFYAFEAVEGTGTTVRGRLEAGTRAQALEQLLAHGRTPLSLKEVSSNDQHRGNLLPRLGSGNELFEILRELSTLLSAGVTIERALQILRGLSPGKARAGKVGKLLEHVRAGQPLSAALHDVFPAASSHVINLIAAGELSGSLPKVMNRLVASLKRARLLRDKVISSLTYPAFLVVTMIAVLWIVFSSILPRLVPMFEQAHTELPAPTSALVAVSEVLTHHGTKIALGAALMVVAFVLALRREKVRLAFDRVMLSSPLLLGIPKAYEAARFCRNLETLLGGGLALDRALLAAQAAAANGWFRKQLDIVFSEVTSGTRLRGALLRAQIFPTLVVELASVGEETGELAPMMKEAAELLEHDVEVRLDRLSTLVLPIATLLMGFLIAGVMAGIVTGLLAINDLGT